MGEGCAEAARRDLGGAARQPHRACNSRLADKGVREGGGRGEGEGSVDRLSRVRKFPQVRGAHPRRCGGLAGRERKAAPPVRSNRSPVPPRPLAPPDGPRWSLLTGAAWRTAQLAKGDDAELRGLGGGGWVLCRGLPRDPPQLSRPTGIWISARWTKGGGGPWPLSLPRSPTHPTPTHPPTVQAGRRFKPTSTTPPPGDATDPSDPVEGNTSARERGVGGGIPPLSPPRPRHPSSGGTRALAAAPAAWVDPPTGSHGSRVPPPARARPRGPAVTHGRVRLWRGTTCCTRHTYATGRHAAAHRRPRQRHVRMWRRSPLGGGAGQQQPWPHGQPSGACAVPIHDTAGGCAHRVRLESHAAVRATTVLPPRRGACPPRPRGRRRLVASARHPRQWWWGDAISLPPRHTPLPCSCRGTRCMGPHSPAVLPFSATAGLLPPPLLFQMTGRGRGPARGTLW